MPTPTTPVLASVSQFKGAAILNLQIAGGKTFMFGRAKAALLLKYRSSVEAFAAGTPLPAETPATISEYNSKPTLILPDASAYGFTFGLEKARLVVASWSAVEQLVNGDPATLPAKPITPDEPVMRALVQRPALLVDYATAMLALQVTPEALIEQAQAIIAVAQAKQAAA